MSEHVVREASFCSACGTELVSGDRYCRSCGVHLTAPQTQYATPGVSRPKPSADGAGRPEASHTSGMAVASVIFGSVGFFFGGSLPAIILGHLARRDIRNSNGTLKGAGLALAGLILGYASIAVGIIVVIALLVMPLTLGSPSSSSAPSRAPTSAPTTGAFPSADSADPGGIAFRPAATWKGVMTSNSGSEFSVQIVLNAEPNGSLDGVLSGTSAQTGQFGSYNVAGTYEPALPESGGPGTITLDGTGWIDQPAPSWFMDHIELRVDHYNELRGVFSALSAPSTTLGTIELTRVDA